MPNDIYFPQLPEHNNAKNTQYFIINHPVTGRGIKIKIEDFFNSIGQLLPDQNGHSGEYLTTNGITAYWNPITAAIIDVTWLELRGLRNTNSLYPGQIYRITDRYNYQSNATGGVPNDTYLGDDRGYVFIKALEVGLLGNEVVRLMACPKAYGTTNIDGNNWIGVWNENTAAAEDDLVVRGGRVFKNLGNDPTGTIDGDNNLDPMNWVLISKSSFSNSEYVDKQFVCLYDFDNDWFEEQNDDSGNTIGLDFQAAGIFSVTSLNPCDITDWNFVAEKGGLFFNNKVSFGIYNNTSNLIYNNTVDYYIKDNILYEITANNVASIYGNKNQSSISFNIGGSIFGNRNTGTISNNKFPRDYQINDNHCTSIKFNTVDGHIYFNYNTQEIAYNNCKGNIINNGVNVGYISYNNCLVISGNNNTGSITTNDLTGGSIQNNTNLSDIGSNKILGNISNNSNTGTITGNDLNSSISSLNNTCLHFYLNKLSNTDFGGVYQEWIIDITGSSTVNLGGYANYLKDVLLTSSNASESITDIVGLPNEQNIKFRPDTGITALTFVHNSAKIRCEGAVSAVLDGSTSDFVEFEKPVNFNAVRQTNIGTY